MIFHVCLLTISIINLKADIYFENCFLKFDLNYTTTKTFIEYGLLKIKLSSNPTQLYLDEYDRIVHNNKYCLYLKDKDNIIGRTKAPDEKCLRFVFVNQSLILLNGEKNGFNTMCNNDDGRIQLKETCATKLLLECGDKGRMWNETTASRKSWNNCYLEFDLPYPEPKRIKMPDKELSLEGSLTTLDENLGVLHFGEYCARAGLNYLKYELTADGKCTKFKYYNDILFAFYKDKYILCVDSKNEVRIDVSCDVKLLLVCKSTTATASNVNKPLPSQNTLVTEVTELSESSTTSTTIGSSANTAKVSSSQTLISEPTGFKESSTTSRTIESSTNRAKVSSSVDVKVIDQMVKSHFVTSNYYISECVMEDIIQNSSVENCLEICIKKKCKSFSHSFKNLCVLNKCVSKKSTLYTTNAEGDHFVYYGQ